MGSITFHELSTRSMPVGLECSHCIHHGLLTGEKVKASFGDGRTLEQARVYCSKCGSRSFSVTRFVRRSEVHAFMRNH